MKRVIDSLISANVTPRNTLICVIPFCAMDEACVYIAGHVMGPRNPAQRIPLNL